jgi:hypothetical protein
MGFALSASALFVEPDMVGTGSGGGVTDGDKGDITVSGGGATWTIDPTVVTYAKIQNVTSARLLGRATAGAGDTEEITLGTNLSFTGTILNAAGGGVSDGDKGDITVSGGGATWTIDNGVVTAAKTAITGVPSGTKYLRDDFSWQAVPAGTVAFTATTLTVPTYGSQSAEVTVVDAAIGVGSKISISWGNFTDADENTPDMDSIQFHAIPAAGSMIVRICAQDISSRVGGVYKINYLIG